ncbi:MAG: chemotaxis protein CheY [Puniceicoccaceae bacterium 5H]|nr:MAG: chemotaxis protein CheY [Puniceicoccaceae bacterium 5H]
MFQAVSLAGENQTVAPLILVADDNAPTREFLTDLLEVHQYRVVGAGNGAEALALASSELPDLILLDILMPGDDGFAVCAKLKANEATRAVPVMFMTALRKTDNKVRGLTAGAVDYLIKPLEPAEVLARIKTHLKLRQLQQALERQNTWLEQRVAERTAELANLNQALKRFVPQEFLSYLEKKSITEVKLGDHIRREMTVMFSDVHGWTQRSERLSPEQNFQFINGYFRQVSPIIRNNGGFVDQYYGDGIMALFDHTPDEAVRAAVEIFRRLDRADVQAELQEPIEIGIGLHTGLLALGILGEEERMQGAVASDNVNLASRLEGLTRLYNARIILSEATFLGLKEPERWQARFLGQIQVKGRTQPVGVYEILDADPPEVRDGKLATLAEYQSALRAFRHGHWDAAIRQFEAIQDINPEDATIQRHLEQIWELRERADEDWAGVIKLQTKG